MTGYKRAKLSQLNRLVTLKNKNSTHKHNISDAASKSVSDMHFAKKLGSLLGQATCTSYPDHQIKSILFSVDVIKNNYLRSRRPHMEACEISDTIIDPYVPKGHLALSDLSGLLERDVSIHLPLLENKHKPSTLFKNNENHSSLVEYDLSDDDI